MRTIAERFWSKVAYGSLDDCWEWTRACKPGGYGQFRVATGESPKRASRVAYLLAYGIDPGDLLVCHHCDNPPCCNPAHLFLGTSAVNVADMMAKGRGPTAESCREAVRRLTDEDIKRLRREHAQGRSCRSLARELGVAHTTVTRLVNGTHWRGYAA